MAMAEIAQVAETVQRLAKPGMKPKDLVAACGKNIRRPLRRKFPEERSTRSLWPPSAIPIV
jgi:Flp pilus assembly protein TadB